MQTKREVRAEFGDGSVAVYGVWDAQLPGLMEQLRSSGLCRRIWLDDRLFMTLDDRDCSDETDRTIR